MTRTKRWWLVSGIVASLVILGSAGVVFGRNSGYGGMMGGSAPATQTGGMIPDGSGNTPSGGLMGGSGWMMATGSAAMMDRADQMMGPLSPSTTHTPVRTLAQAQQVVQHALMSTHNPALKVDEVMEFQQNFYAIVKDTRTGHGAFEVLVNKDTGTVYLEYGPAMMWNTHYGMAGHMMGYEQPSGAMAVSATQARTTAQDWLDKTQPGSTTEAPGQFPGYYTVHILKSGKVTGVLSVNGYSGAVWYHTWHGVFVQMKDLGV